MARWLTLPLEPASFAYSVQNKVRGETAQIGTEESRVSLTEQLTDALETACRSLRLAEGRPLLRLRRSPQSRELRLRRAINQAVGRGGAWKKTTAVGSHGPESAVDGDRRGSQSTVVPVDNRKADRSREGL